MRGQRHKRHLSPRLVRLGAILLFGAITAALIISVRMQYGFLRRGHTPFAETAGGRRLVSLSENVRHVQTENNRPVFALTARRAEVYDDGHQEFKDVELIVYRSSGDTRARITAARATYNESTGSVLFATDVRATTDDGMTVNTDRLRYTQGTGVIETDVPVTFVRDAFEGESRGMVIETARGREEVVLAPAVRVTFRPRAPRMPSPTSPLTARCDMARFRRVGSVLELIGSVVMEQQGQQFRADRVEAFFDSARRLRQVNAFGNAELRARASLRSSELKSRTMGFFFSESQHLVRAIATGDAWARIAEALGERELRTSRIEVNFAPRGRRETEIYPSEVKGDGGRVEVVFSAPGGAPVHPRAMRASPLAVAAPSTRRLEANAIRLFYRPARRILDRITAEGDVILVVEPLGEQWGERKAVRADRMEARFDEHDNLMRGFAADGHVRVEIHPPPARTTEQKTRMATSDHLTAEFDRETQDIVRLVQWGHFRYREKDRQASSERALYDRALSTISLRGTPVVWDDRSRTQADEIDWDTRAEKILARGKVLTTYLNRQATGGASPFALSAAPVFLAADRLEVDYRAETAVYRGGARAWQEDSYIAAETIELHRSERLMVARGSVRSLFYKARRATASPQEAVPIFVAAERMSYRDSLRLVAYAGDVTFTRGSQRLSAETVTVTLKPEEAEIERAVAETTVSLTDRGRRAFGERALYLAATDELVLTGTPARVEDDRQHLRQNGARLTFLLADDKVFVESDGSSRRVKTIRKIQ